MVGNGSTDQEHHVAFGTATPQPVALQRVNHARHKAQMRPRQDADADDVHVLLGRRRGHLVGGDPHSQVDNLHAGVAQRAGNDLDTAVMAVQAELGEEDAGWIQPSI